MTTSTGAAAVPLRYRVYEDALLVPSASRTVYRDIDGAVFDADLRPIEGSLLTRTWTPPEISFHPDVSGLDLASVETVEGPHIYGGYWFDHFGHFLLESLARAWVVEEVGPLPFAWAAGGPPTAWQAETLGLLGLTTPHRFPQGPTRFHRLVIAEPGYRIQTFFHPRHARFLARWDEDVEPEASRKVWLSRTGVDDPRRRSRGEARLQSALADRGWDVVHPERLGVADQLRTMAGADVVAGIEGSAFHAAVLLTRPPGPFIVLRRGTSPNYRTIADRRGIVEFDLYGAQRVADRKDNGLVRPARWARVVDGLAEEVGALCGDPARLEALRREAEARHDYDEWLRRQAWRVTGPRAKAAVRGAARKARALLRRS